MPRAPYPSSTPSWDSLSQLRRRGQRPAFVIFITDHGGQRRNLCDSGGYALRFPEPEEAYLVAGLDVVIIADGGGRAVEAAQDLAGANPRYLATYWRGQGLSVVMGRT